MRHLLLYKKQSVVPPNSWSSSESHFTHERFAEAMSKRFKSKVGGDLEKSWNACAVETYCSCVQSVGQVHEKARQCGRISTEESEFLRRSCCVRMPVVIMGTPHGRASAPSAGENELDQPEPPDRIPGTAWCLNNTQTQTRIQIF